MLRASLYLCLFLAGCSSLSSNEKADHHLGRAELQLAIVALCEAEQRCIEAPESTIDECVHFLWDVTHHSYPEFCYGPAARFARCLSSQPCDDAEHSACDADEQELNLCSDGTRDSGREH